MNFLIHLRQADLLAGEFEESSWIILCINCLSFKTAMLFSLSCILVNAAAINDLVSWDPAREDSKIEHTVKWIKSSYQVSYFTLIEASNKWLIVTSFSHLDNKVCVRGKILQHTVSIL